MAQLVVRDSGAVYAGLRKPAPDDNFSSSFDLEVGENNTQVDYVSRGYLKFDISSIPAGATITSATLAITPVADLSDNARTISVYRVLKTAVNTQLTWNSYSTGNAWDTAGAGNTTTDREASAIGTATQPASPTLNTPITINITAAKIQEITSGAFTNNGFLLQVDTETDDRINYAACDNATAAYRPTLTVNYSVSSALKSALLMGVGI